MNSRDINKPFDKQVERYQISWRRKNKLLEGKWGDYLLIDMNNKIFIDAKGVEMSYLGMVGHQPEVIKDKTRDSIVKGIKQGFETAKRLENIDKIGEIEAGKGNNYLIVVTFKDMYVGNGLDFYEYVAKDTQAQPHSSFVGSL